MKKLTEIALNRPVTTIMIFVSILLLGGLATQRLPLAFLPDMTGPGLWIDIPYPGSTPEEVERLITKPAEEVLSTVSGIKTLNSWSRENGAGIQIGFNWGDPVELKVLEVKEKLDGIRDQWPDDVQRFFVFQWSTDDWAIVNLRISADRDLSNAFELLNKNLVRPIERIEGVSKVTLYGVEQKQVKIELLSSRLAAYNIDLQRLTTTLRKANFSISGGQITDGEKRYQITPVGEIRSVDDYANLVVAGTNVRLKDIAKISYEQPERDYGRHLDMKYAIGLEVFKDGTANTVDVSNALMQELEVIKKNPEMSGIQMFVMNNQADGIVNSLEELLKSGLIGALMSILVLYYFLRHIPSTLVVALSVPFSLLVTLAAMYFMDMSLNILSMMGLMLAIGMLVDNAVVVTENIFRFRQLGGDPFEQTKKGVSEVALAVIAGTATTAIVFLPNIIDQSNELSIQLYHVAITIVISLGASLIISQTIVPMLTARFTPPPPSQKITLIDRLEGRYARTLNWMIHHKWWAALTIILILGSVAIPVNFVKTEMFEDGEQRQIRIFYHLNGIYDLETVEKAVFEVEEFLYANAEKFEIESVYSWFETRSANSTLTLYEGDDAVQSSKEIMDSLRTQLPKLAIAELSFEWRRNNAGGDQIRVNVSGESSEILAEMTLELVRLFNLTPGLADAKTDAEAGDEEILVVVDRARARMVGLDPQQISQMVSIAMRGTNLPRFYSEFGETQVAMQFEGSEKQTIDDLKNMPIYLPNGNTVKLSSVANFEIRKGPRAVRHQNRITSLGVSVNTDGITSEEARKTITDVMSRFQFPAGYGWSYGERFNFEAEAEQTMVVNTLLALVLIYLVMAALFESVLFPLSIWTSIVFAIVGVWWFFFITGTAFSFMAWIGILILIGIVVNNGIVLIDYVNQLRREGLDREEAIVTAGKSRLRPILMTAGTTVLGLLPLCISSVAIGGDGPPYYPMARAIVGGLIFSTVITVLILPNIYVMLDDAKRWTSRVSRNAKLPWKQVVILGQSDPSPKVVQ